MKTKRNLKIQKRNYKRRKRKRKRRRRKNTPFSSCLNW
jgi:hypothetical protein